MKYKNYVNSYSKDNRIYSREDILNMPVRDAFLFKNDIMTQDWQIGTPNASELAQSPNVIWVESYTRDDGTKVEGHWRSKPESGSSLGLNSEKEMEYRKESDKLNIQKEMENALKEQETVQNPTAIAGVKRNKPMSFEEAAGEEINPHYIDGPEGNFNNCQCCVVAYEARRRGYDVEAEAQNGEGKPFELSFRPFEAWLDKNGEVCKGEVINVKNAIECYDWLDNKVKNGERYAFVFYTITEREERIYKEGHIEVLDKDNNNKLRLYDPQSDITRDKELIIGRLDGLANFTELPPKILRIDNKQFNPYFINEVVHGRE